MSGFAELSLPGGMSSSRHNLMKDFYAPCLARSSRFDRAAGYFSSAIFALAPLAYSDFFLKGGRIRLVSSTQLSPQDADAVFSESNFDYHHLVSALQDLRESNSSSFGVLSRLFASLLHSGLLELKFVQPRSSRGIFHDKYGIFIDDQGGYVSFIGSTNETAFAWSGLHNHEQIEIFRSNHESDRARIADHVESFERIWSNQLPGFEIFSSKEFESELLRIVPPEPIEELTQELRLRDSAEIRADSEIQPVYELRGYQEEALKNWALAERRGIISFATGGGKTLTAIEAIRLWLETGPALVLVPSALLLEQWKSELRSWLPDANLLQVGAGNAKRTWIKDLYRFSQQGQLGKRIILSTYASASTPEFKAGINYGQHLMVVADEVHRFGATDARTIANWLECGARLGLSATPIRQGDSEGTEAVFDFFGPLVSPIYSLEDAIRDGVLVPYDYELRMAPLDQEEQEQWELLSTKISRELAMNDGKQTELAKRLMIRRARISKRAKSKADIAARIIVENLKPNDRWLVYCESLSHLEEVRSSIKAAVDPSVTVMEFHSRNKEEHRRVIRFFEARGGIVLAIKCLDEGIDIPIINRAIILSSSTNPREYVQRRGRVLRRHPKKLSAQIWDLLTVDDSGLPIAQTEVIRAAEFAGGSRSKSVGLELDLLSDRAAKVEGSDFDLA